MDLHGKVAVVTGASAGLGKVLAEYLVDKGSIVFGLARSREGLKELESRFGEGFQGVPCDVREEQQVEEAFRIIARDSGRRIDVLINNAGLGRFGPVDALSTDDWNVQIDTNLTGVYLCTRAALPFMKQQNRDAGFGGHIINVASVAGLVGNANLAAYNATKFGLRGFSEALMKEVRDDGIKVTCLYPGSIDTNFQAVSGSAGSPNAMLPQDIASTVVHVLEAVDNYLISEVVMRPLRPKG